MKNILSISLIYLSSLTFVFGTDNTIIMQRGKKIINKVDVYTKRNTNSEININNNIDLIEKKEYVISSSSIDNNLGIINYKINNKQNNAFNIKISSSENTIIPEEKTQMEMRPTTLPIKAKQ